MVAEEAIGRPYVLPQGLHGMPDALALVSASNEPQRSIFEADPSGTAEPFSPQSPRIQHGDGQASEARAYASQLRAVSSDGRGDLSASAQVLQHGAPAELRAMHPFNNSAQETDNEEEQEEGATEVADDEGNSDEHEENENRQEIAHTAATTAAAADDDADDVHDEQDDEVQLVEAPREVIVVDDSPPAPSTSARLATSEPGKCREDWVPRDRLEEEDDVTDESTTCLICYEPWCTSGPHRLVSLACGHLYGKACIIQWLTQKKKCPQCNGRARREDIRPIFASRLVAVDNSEVVEAQERAQAETRRRQALEASHKEQEKEIQRMQSQLKSLQAGLQRQEQRQERLDASLKRQRTSPGPGPTGRQPPATSATPATPATQPHRRGLVSPVGSVTVPARGSRSFDLDPSRDLLVLSDKPTNGPVGLRKVSLLAPRQPHTIPLKAGTGVIRDIQLGSSFREQALVACVGPNPLQLVSVASQSVVASFPLSSAAWSCAWDNTSEYKVYAGCQDGSVTLFDLRRVDSPLQAFSPLAGRQPVHSLQVLSRGALGKSLLTGSISGVHSWRLDGPSGDYAPGEDAHEAQQDVQVSRLVEGAGAGGSPCMSFSCLGGVGVASFRATAARPAHHCVLQQQGGSSDEEGAWQVHGELQGHGFTSHTTMSRTALVPHPLLSSSRCNMWPLLASADEATKQPWLWDLSDGTIACRLAAHPSPVLSLRYHHCIDNRPCVTSLSETMVHFHRLS